MKFTISVTLGNDAMLTQDDVAESLERTAKKIRDYANPPAAGEGGRGWAVRFQFATPKQNLIKYEARLRPGESRTYTVAVRVAKSRDQWMRTLLPYRTYFRAQYGGVQ